MNKTCISHLRIAEADQIQILVSRVPSGGGKLPGTDVTIQALSKDKRGNRSNSRKLPPLQIAVSKISVVRGKREYDAQGGIDRTNCTEKSSGISDDAFEGNHPEEFQGSDPQLLSPKRLSSSPSTCCSNYRSGLPPSLSSSSSRFHQSCLHSRPASPMNSPTTTLPALKGSGIPIRAQVRSRSSSPFGNTSAFKNSRKEEIKEDEEVGASVAVEDPMSVWKIEQYLLNNPEFVDAHVRKYWDRYGYTHDQKDVLDRQKTLNEFLLSMVRSIFQDMVSMDMVIKKVMNFAQRLVDADRASLFLIDSKSGELYARIFDMGGGHDLKEQIEAAEATNIPASQITREIRFKIGTGIAGRVALTGETLNIVDAYADPRFNRTVDQVTGYVTKTILCMPIFIRGSVMGVVQMVNKRVGEFNHDDVEAFETFAVYCGLALHHAKLYDKIRRSEQKFKVALDVLSYHNICTEHEFSSIRNEGPSADVPENFTEFSYVTLYVDDMKKIHYAVHMFIDLFGLARFDLDSLYKFVITVKKNYRRVPYHNWAHGFTVAHCMYCILKKTNVFKPLECLSLYVGCLCHDLDHRGRNNQFMQDTSSPLASIYTTSTLEHHHFNQTVAILQQEGLNIFSKLSSEEYKQVLGNIKHCILATDLALFFSNKAKLANILDEKRFTWNNPQHRLLAQAIGMTAADLCASAKPWEVQAETVRVIFEEFYEQGDLEKKQGRTPIPMMDRDKAHQLPSSQVGFLSVICISCYDLLYQLIPSTKPLLEGCQKNLMKWKEVAEKQSETKDNSEKAIEDKPQ